MSESIRDGGQGSTIGRGRRGVLAAFVRVEIALALVLLTGAGLLIKSFATLAAVDPGFRPEGLLTFTVDLPRSRYADRVAVFGFHQRLAERLGAIPGVHAVGGVSTLPFAPGNWCTSVRVRDRAPVSAPGGESECVEIAAAHAEYFRALGVRVVQGRLLAPQDADGSPLVAVINERMATRYWPGASPLGKRFAFDDKEAIEVVGVVSAVRQFGLDREAVPQLYMPLRQLPQRLMSVTVRTEGDAASLATQVRAVVRDLDPDLYVNGLRTMRDRVSASMATPRLRSVVLGAFATVAFLLAVVGVYGVMAFAVSQRQRELGIRAALGATARTITRDVLAEGARLAVVGVVAGVAGALALTRVLSKALFGVSAQDPWVFGGAAVGLVVVALAACWIPARRAARVDPVLVVKGG